MSPPKAGHYESFYLKLVQPGGGRGAWIRHTVHKRPGEDATCALWFVLFDSSAAGPRATKRQFGADQLSAGADTYIRVADATLADGRAIGRVGTDALEASWDLSFADEHEPFHHLPRDFLYARSCRRPSSSAPTRTRSSTAGSRWAASESRSTGWRGMIGHNWGAEHAERWVWIQGSGFEGHSPEDYFDMAVGRIKVAGRTTPVGRQRDADARRPGPPARRLRARPEHRGERAADRRRFELKGKGVKVTGNVRAAAKDFVAWIYADPVGPEHNTLNCSISDLELEVELDGGPAERLTVSGAAAYEFGTRDTDHGIPVQPYPDG